MSSRTEQAVRHPPAKRRKTSVKANQSNKKGEQDEDRNGDPTLEVKNIEWEMVRTARSRSAVRLCGWCGQNSKGRMLYVHIS